MCMGGAPKDNSAAIARKEEEDRQARIKQGVSNIDQAFAGYDDDFFNKYQSDYTGYYNPQLEDQYSDAAKKLKLQLARTGNITGSVGANQMADLTKYYDTQKLALTNQALDAVNELRGKIDTKKSDLYVQNRASADPANASATAKNVSRYLQPTMPTSPLANVFTGFFDNVGNLAAISNARKLQQGTGVSIYDNKTKPSTRVVS